MRSDGPMGRTTNFEAPPATYSSSLSVRSAGGPNAVQATSVRSSTPPRGRERAPAREVVEHRELARGEHGGAEGRHEHARAELEPPRARRDGRHGDHGLEHRQRRGEPLGEPERVDLGPLAEVDEPPEEL